jgi:hypothetical protein
VQLHQLSIVTFSHCSCISGAASPCVSPPLYTVRPFFCLLAATFAVNLLDISPPGMIRKAFVMSVNAGNTPPRSPLPPPHHLTAPPLLPSLLSCRR